MSVKTRNAGASWKAPCLTEDCENMAGHATGLCTECRTVKCALCGGALFKQNLTKKNNKCGKCKKIRKG